MKKDLIDLIACPACKGPLVQSHNKDALICKAERLRFPIEDGIPMLLVEEASSLTTDAMNEEIKGQPAT
ncbi:MAG: Trm112 family protein [Gammaproteobacteria bacterium]|nr:Trm112 family protein [Gammaproteobacteria bacterium]